MLTLDPAAPLLWRSPTSLQLGVAPVLAVLPEVSGVAESVLAALRTGASRAELDLLGPPDAVGALLDRLRPALVTVRNDRPVPVRLTAPRPAHIDVDGPDDLVRSIGGGLHLLGHPVRRTAGSDLPGAPGGSDLPGGSGVVVLAAHHVLSPHRAARWMTRDVPHLPVIVLDQAALVGPLVVPGSTACLRCADEHRLDDDPAWPAIGAQLLRRRPAGLAADPRVLAEVVAVLGRALSGDPAAGPLAGVEVRIDGRSGAVSRRDRPWHERCLCRSLAQPAADRPGTGTENAARDADPLPRRRAAAAAAPA